MEIEQQELPFPVPPEAGILDTLAHIQAQLETMYESMLPVDSVCECVGHVLPSPALKSLGLGGLARVIVALKGVIAAARDAMDLVEQHTIRTMPDRQAVVDGFVLERKSGTVRKAWDHPLLASLVARRATFDAETGEVLIKPEDAQRVIDELLTVGHIDYWRAGALRERGIDPDQYCETQKGRASLIVRAPE
jgi:hypothetical protein